MPPVGAASKGEIQDVTTAGEQPARSPVGAANEGGTHGKSTEYLQSNHRLILFFLGVCYATTRSSIRCRKRVKNGKYCPLHQKEY